MDESPEQCANRELQEEIGEDHRIELIQAMGPVRDTHYGGIYQIWLYHYRWLEGEVILNPEHTDYAWVGRDNIQQYPLMKGIEEDIRYLGIWADGQGLILPEC